MDLLDVDALSKSYDTFQLRQVSFTLPAGYIMGFIGRNGAGKTTTIKAMLNLVRPDSGRVSVCGQDWATHEQKLKTMIGLALGPVDYYPKSPLRRISGVVRQFYPTWDERSYRSYMERFDLDESKTVEHLSAGMRVKYGLALALSHQAKLLILDEPTSGLDPVSRDDLLDVFRELIESGDRSILYSTQITSDLEKCADYITYIRQGQIVASCDKDEFQQAYRLVRGPKTALGPQLVAALIGSKVTELGFTGLIHTEASSTASGCELTVPTIDDIMIYHERQPREELR
ncbi:MAG: ABC transporter ATP-binding protein [Propionibacteriaceae bacterium]|jgi:ABC-2 type transport system ATP-binding protein|nr:ABC transporter ATP-binding protein [Propionibacteriaceae bacterium]